jgi:predicted DNA-binding transcriptional regulator AlpA
MLETTSAKSGKPPRNEYVASDPLLTRDQVAAELGVSVGTVDRYRLNGTIPAPLKLAGRPRWRRSAIEAVKAGAAGSA